jgi:Glyoxalase-like domain
MTLSISRRTFLANAAGAVLSASGSLWAASETQVPSLLDHILLGCDDLDRGIDFVYQRTGVRAAFGGVHPGRGTRNALLSLGERRYLEIIAPDPQQTSLTQYPEIKAIAEPTLIGWAVHPPSVGAIAQHLRDAGVAFKGPTDGSRQRPDGKLLRWRSVNLNDAQRGLLPFFIEWSADSVHPSVDAPQGCRLASFTVVSPNSDELAKIFQQLDVAVSVEHGLKPRLRAVIAAPTGQLELHS